MRLLIKDIAYIDAQSGAVTERGYMIVDGPRIEAIGPGDSGQRGPFDETIDGSGRLLLPGFINTHGHAAMSLLRGYADDTPLERWLNDLIWPAEAQLSAQDIRVGAQLAMLEMIETGTTTFTDMYMHMDQVATAAIEGGMRAVLGRGLVGLAPNAPQMLVEAEAFVREFEGAGDGRIRTNLAPHAPYTCPPEYLKRILALAERLGVPLQIHIAETAQEVAESRAQYGLTPTELLHREGLFAFPLVGAHCVHVSDHDIELLAESRVHVAHNPGSNLKLGSGVAPLVKFLERGVVVGLGTDGAASNNKLDVYEEMRLCALLHKGVLQSATAVTAAQAFWLATGGGAQTLFLEQGLGLLQAGAPADFQFVDITGPRYHPRHSLLSHIVYSSHAGDVTDVFAAGRPLLRKRQFVTLDKEKIVAQAQTIAAKFPGTRLLPDQ
ncbi:MAG: amidohydrolase [Bacilli bacterium]